MRGLKSQLDECATCTPPRPPTTTSVTTRVTTRTLRTPARNIGLRSLLGTGAVEAALRDDDDIAGLQRDVLIQIAPAHDIGVAERQRLLLTGVGAAEDHDVAEGCERRRAAG